MARTLQYKFRDYLLMFRGQTLPSSGSQGELNTAVIKRTENAVNIFCVVLIRIVILNSNW